MRKYAAFCLIAAAVFLVLAPSPVSAAASKKKPKVQIDDGRIYLGDPTDFTKPAQVDVDKVYLKIPEYQEVRNRNMDESNPRYLILMRAASDKFRAAIEGVSQDKGYDLIGGLGAIKIEGQTVPDITDLVIKKLK